MEDLVRIPKSDQLTPALVNTFMSFQLIPVFDSTPKSFQLTPVELMRAMSYQLTPVLLKTFRSLQLCLFCSGHSDRSSDTGLGQDVHVVPVDADLA